MAQTLNPAHALRERAGIKSNPAFSEDVGTVLAQAEVLPSEELPVPLPEPVQTTPEAAAPADAGASPKDAEVLPPVEPEASAVTEQPEPAEAEAPVNAPAETEAEVPATAEAEIPATAEPEAPVEAGQTEPDTAEVPAQAEAPAEAEPEAEASAPAEAPAKHPVASEGQPEKADKEAPAQAAEGTTPDGAATEDKNALTEALDKDEKAAGQGAQQDEPAAAKEKAQPEAEDELGAALAEQEKASGKDDQQPADAVGTTKPGNVAAEESTAKPGSKTAPAASAATDAEIPELTALSEEGGKGEVTEEKVTEENSRSSSEDFRTNLGETTADADGQKPKNSDDDDDDNTLAKAALLGLGGLAVGAMLSNNRQVELSTPDRLVVTHPDGSQEVIKDETALLRQPGSTVTTENFEDGSSRTIVTRADGSKIVTIRDGNLRVLRRTSVAADGSSMALIDDTTAAVPVDIASLPAAAEAVQTPGNALNEEELREALLREVNAGRQFTLGQIRNISEVRALVAPIDINAITFDTGSAAIKADQARQLSTLGKVIQQAIQDNPQEIFLVEGHTDSVGDAAMNLALSDRRAESVALALTEYFDVHPENLVTQGYGEQFLKVQAEGENRENRRASIRRITKLLQTAAAE